MEEMTQSSASGETQGSANLLAKFRELPGGVQRIIIAVLLLLILVAAMFLQRLIRVEEGSDPDVAAVE